MGETTQLLASARNGDPDAWERVVVLLYDDLLRLARRTVRGRGACTLNATALVHECYLRVAGGRADAITSSHHFLALASRAMRQILVNHARDRVAAKRGGGAIHVTLERQQLSADQEADDVLMLDEALVRLAREDERLSQVIDCRIFGGLTEMETASALGIPLRTVQRRWQQARERLRVCLQPG
ncbi:MULTISPECIES: ECF-type sigma factor [Rhodanobacter]|jgi:RNA polymerase sigma factor (TIGR02999 family)|nr:MULTISPECIES: ECF-type sigma factor [Rhodanobacter]EIL88441.1 RNA polymerase sigma factor [Rhodanobacter sp. 115]SFL09387.1 RNA polymerase sigma factor, TIGR02999 family [Rhodanobacter glycinis]